MLNVFNDREKELQAEALKIIFGAEGTEDQDVFEKLAEKVLKENKKLKLPPDVVTRYSFFSEKEEDPGPQDLKL